MPADVLWPLIGGVVAAMAVTVGFGIALGYLALPGLVDRFRDRRDRS